MPRTRSAAASKKYDQGAGRNISISLAQAEHLARTIAKQLQGGDILALIGPLGSGKTTFTKALAKALGIQDDVTSPTFSLMNRYRFLLGDKPAYLYHLDLYRTESLAEIKALGLMEIWDMPDAVTVVEWADKLENHLPKKSIMVHFSHDE